MDHETTIRLPRERVEERVEKAQQAAQPGDLTDALLAKSPWSDEDIAAAAIPVVDVPFVTIGGGVGSYTMVDYLRIAGVAVDQIATLTPAKQPWEQYEYLTRVSQIPRGERLRSDSGSCPDNVWGFPSFAVRESLGATSLTERLAPLWQVLSEPVLTDYYTPRAGQVFDAMQREADRIDYWSTVVPGFVRMVRPRIGGGYFSILTPPPGTSPTKRLAYRSRFVHLAVGYPGLKFLPDLQQYKTEHNDYYRVVNAYERHEHVYEDLKKAPGSVMIRGAGIVASRILQRLIDDREKYGLNTQIFHLFRTYQSGTAGPNVFLRRPGAHGWAYQGFNWPKASWGGQIKSQVERLENQDRKRIYEVLGGTHTPHRKLWIDQLARGRAGGWYHELVGQVKRLDPAGHQVVSQIQGPESEFAVPCDFVIDCTGLEADISEHRILADLLSHGGARRNPMGRLDVERTFEVRGTRSESGRLYVSGSAALGGYYMGVDSFLGLQYAALQICDDLARQGFGKRIGLGRSVRQWLRWVRHTSPS